MKKFMNPKAGVTALIGLFAFFFCTGPVKAQTDTLHLNYHHTQIQPHDSIVAKIEKWAKSLNGKHVDIEVVAYFHKPEFKKFSQQRADELFLILNRKARELITITFIGPRKGADSQRTRVDILYKPTVTPEQAAAAAAKVKAEADAKKEAEKTAKDKDKVAKESDKPAKSTDKKEDKSTPKKETAEKGEKKAPAKKGESPKPNEAYIANGGPGKKPATKGSFVTQSDVVLVKSARLIVPRTDNPGMDSLMTLTIKGFWNFSNNVEYGTMTYKEAKALAKKDEKVLIFIVADAVSSSLKKQRAGYDMLGQAVIYEHTNISTGTGLMLEDGKGKLVITSYFPSFGNDKLVAPEVLAFAVSEMNSLLSNLEKYNIKNNMTFNKPFKQNASKLKGKTLLIPGFWLSKKVEVAEIPSLYEGKAAVVEYENWVEAILKKKDVAYVIVVPYATGGKYIYLHYLMDAATGDVLFISQPKAGVDVEGINVSAANTGYINAKNLKRYNDAFDMKAAEEESAENAEKASESKEEKPKDKESSEEKKEDAKEKPKKEKKEKPKEEEKAKDDKEDKKEKSKEKKKDKKEEEKK